MPRSTILQFYRIRWKSRPEVMSDCCFISWVTEWSFNINFIFCSNMTSFKRFESKPVVKIILILDRLNLKRHRQFITIFYQFLYIRIEIIHWSHIYVLFLPLVGLYVSFLPLANSRGKTSWHKSLPVVKTIYAYGFHELFLKHSVEKFYWKIKELI